MINQAYFKGVIDKPTFSRQELMNSFRDGGFDLSVASFNKKLNAMLKKGEITPCMRKKLFRMEILIRRRRKKKTDSTTPCKAKTSSTQSTETSTSDTKKATKKRTKKQ